MTEKNYGPTLPISREIHEMKYRSEGETFVDAVNRQASTLSDNADHRRSYSDILLNQRFMPAGRVQAAIGSPRVVTPWNCFVSGTINDSFDDIMGKAKEAGTTMRLGGGIGYDFSTLRPKGERIKSLGSQSSGPVSFMDIYDSICGTIASAGHRRGAQMGVMRVDHPDIMEFIHAKRNSTRLTRFNISVGVTDAFMEAVRKGTEFPLKWRGRIKDKVDARALWDDIMRSTWDWAEPGVLFIDRINEYNNLWYCENIAATNPCGEQPLPPYGACLLGSFNLVKYVTEDRGFDFDKFAADIPHVVRAMDNIIDVGTYPLPSQEEEGKNKRRMGLGVTGVANAIEAMGHPYASDRFIARLEKILKTLRDETYRASVELAKEKGPFPLFDADKYLQGKFIETLPFDIRQSIFDHGIRNSHLLSIAPTGTISLSADNVSSGIEPVFTYEYNRTIQTFDGPVIETVPDYGYRVWGVEGRTADEVSVEEHVRVLGVAQEYVDSACSKTCNVGDDVDWERFKDVYMLAYDLGAKGCTTFRAAGKRYGILNKKEEKQEREYIDDEDSVEACFIDPQTGQPTCS
jgi:ribonucleoside-diphosphate reductase alpha chain